MDEMTHHSADEKAIPPDSLPSDSILDGSVVGEERLLGTFFAEAAAVEPDPLPTAGQLRWRAEVLARLASEERRATRAGNPALVAVIVAALAALTALALFFSGIRVDVIADLGAWLVATPWRPLLLVAFVLSLTGCVASVGLQRNSR